MAPVISFEGNDKAQVSWALWGK